MRKGGGDGREVVMAEHKKSFHVYDVYDMMAGKTMRIHNITGIHSDVLLGAMTSYIEILMKRNELNTQQLVSDNKDGIESALRVIRDVS